jgi:hypothetical protein
MYVDAAACVWTPFPLVHKCIFYLMVALSRSGWLQVGWLVAVEVVVVVALGSGGWQLWMHWRLL